MMRRVERAFMENVIYNELRSCGYLDRQELVRTRLIRNLGYFSHKISTNYNKDCF